MYKRQVVHPSAGHYSDTLVNAIMYHCKDSLSGINGEIRPGIAVSYTHLKLLEQEIAGIVYSKIKSGEIPISDVYFALINNNVIDLTHFNASDASATEQAIYNSFSGQLQDALSTIDRELESGTSGTASTVSYTHLCRQYSSA